MNIKKFECYYFPIKGDLFFLSSLSKFYDEDTKLLLNECESNRFNVKEFVLNYLNRESYFALTNESSHEKYYKDIKNFVENFLLQETENEPCIPAMKLEHSFNALKASNYFEDFKSVRQVYYFSQAELFIGNAYSFGVVY